MQINATQIRSGQALVLKGELHRVMEMTHVTPGKGQALVQTKLRNMRTGLQVEHRFRPSDKVETAHIDSVEMQYLYSDGSGHYFMNMETFEQVPLSEEMLGDRLRYLLPETMVTVDFFEGNPVDVELPTSVVLEVVETEPPLKGATAAGGSKPAKLETGLTVDVPNYLKAGAKVEVDTRTGEFLSRAEKA